MVFKTRLAQLIVPALLLALIASFIGPGAGTAQANPGWYDTDWGYRKQVTINSAQVAGSANLTGFPVLVQITDSDLSTYAQTDGDDILFTLGDEVTKIPHEIEYFNQPSGNLTAWVTLPSLSPATDTDIYMYYGNAAASNQQDAANVWDSSFAMVQHLEETSGGASAITDSTGNGNDGTDNNTPAFSAAGRMDGAIDFDGTTEAIQMADSASLDITSAITLEAWIYPTTVDTNHRRIMVKSHTTWAEPYYMYSLWIHADGLGFGTYNGTTRTWDTNGTITPGTWQHVVGTQGDGQQKWYIDGSLVATGNVTGSIAANNEPLLIGNNVNASLPFDGIIDEVRISGTARSAEWIETEYNNQAAPASFITLGAPEAAPAVPAVSTSGVSSVEETTATFVGNIVSTGGDPVDARGFEYGLAADWPSSTSTIQESAGPYGVGSYNLPASGLSKGRTYNFRAAAHNTAGWGYGSPIEFFTKPDEPASLTATTVSSSQINLDWVKGAGANTTMVRYRYDTYPANAGDGMLAYNGTGTSYSHGGLPPSVTVYYAAWSVGDDGGTLYAFSDASVMANATTTSGVPTVIGGVVLKINKASLLAPWAGLSIIGVLVLTRLYFYIRRRSNRETG